jgi:shikimate kinase
MNIMLDTGLTVYLKLTPLQLKKRLTGSKTERPLIKNLDPAGLQSFIEEKLTIRESCYNRSDIIIEGIDPDINLILTLVKSRLDI